MFQTSGPGREIINGEKKIRDGRHLLDLTGTESIGIQSASHFFFQMNKKIISLFMNNFFYQKYFQQKSDFNSSQFSDDFHRANSIPSV